MKFCPHCGQRLSRFNLEEEKRHVQKPEPPSKKKWSERHPGWVLLLVIVLSPLALYGLFVALVMLLSLFASSIPGIAEAIIRGTITAMPFAYIAIVIGVVRWYRQERRQSRIIADYNKAIELDSRYSLAYFNRAYAYGEMGEYDKAIADYSKAIELDPGDAQAYYNRAHDYQSKREVLNAVNDLEKCIELSTAPELTKDARQALFEAKNSSRKGESK